jgi:hypothetical protein
MTRIPVGLLVTEVIKMTSCTSNIGELTNLTTKIITLLEFFNFVNEVSRLQYE